MFVLPYGSDNKFSIIRLTHSNGKKFSRAQANNNTASCFILFINERY